MTTNDDNTSINNSSIIVSIPEETKEVITPVPWRSLFIVLLVFIADAFSFTTLAPYITEFVVDLGVVPDGDMKKIGYYAGLIGGSYYVTQFFSAMIWGWLSDRYGRKPILLIGAAGSCIASFLFGLSKSIYWAIVTRALFGLNGNLGVYKVYLGEISDKTNQAKVFSYFSVSFSLTSIVGPIIGGFLASPMKQYPALANILPARITSFFKYFPFILPNALMSLMNLLAFILAFLYLKETNRALLTKRENVDLEVHETDTPIELETEIEREEDVIQDNIADVDQQYEDNNESDLDKLQDNDNEEEFKQVPSSWREYLSKRLNLDNEIFKSRAPLSVALVYALLGFVNIIYVEIMPLFLVLKPEDGGLNFDLKQIGILNAVASVIVLFWTIFASPRIIKRLGPTRTLKMGKLNGISQSGVALVRSIGPIIGGSIFSWSLTTAIPFKMYIIFILMIIVYLVLLGIVLPLPNSLDSPKNVPEEETAGET